MLHFSQSFSNDLQKHINLAKSSIVIASAYTKVKALKHFLCAVADDVDVKVISRWQKVDLLSKASDIEVYEFCKEKGWDFGIDLNFHGKFYLVDSTDFFSGSANMTQKGMGLVPNSNFEVGTSKTLAADELSMIDRYLRDEIVWINDSLYHSLFNELEDTIEKSCTSSQFEWSKTVNDILNVDIRSLWTNELPFCDLSELLNFANTVRDFSNPTVCILHDLSLLGLSPQDLNNFNLLKQRIIDSRVMNWFFPLIKINKEMSFGKITYELHNALLNDPKPYRKSVKDFVQNLFSWASILNDTFEVKKYNYRSSIVLKSEDSQPF